MPFTDTKFRDGPQTPEGKAASLEALEANRADPTTSACKHQGRRWQDRATDLRRQGQTLQQIADAFNDEGHRTATGAEYKPTTVARMVNRVDPSANPVGGYRGGN